MSLFPLRSQVDDPFVNRGKLTYYRRLWTLYRNFRRGREILPPPLRMWVELSSRCNLRCSMCPNKDLPPEHKGDMSGEMFFRLIDEVRAQVFEIALHHRGESLLHPQVLDFVEYAARSGMRTKLHTNGTLLTEDISRGLVASGLDYLSLSIDGFTAEEYEKIRVGADFTAVLANIRMLLAVRAEAKRKKPIVAVEVIQLASAADQRKRMAEFLALFPGFRPDRLIVKNPHNWAGYLESPRQKKRYCPCPFPWNALLVFWNGWVSPCAQDFFGSYIVGDLNRQGVLEIWNGEPMRRLRRGLATGRYADFSACAECDRLWRDTLLGIPREYLKPLLFKRMP